MKVEQNLRQLNIKQIQQKNDNNALVQRPVSYTQPHQTTFTGAGFVPFLKNLSWRKVD